MLYAVSKADLEIGPCNKWAFIMDSHEGEEAEPRKKAKVEEELG